MNFYSNIYIRLCQRGLLAESRYGHGSGLHKHHVIPKHSGGSDAVTNFTYLSVREHIIAHYLLWKIHKNINDLRSMKMLGANLSFHHRRLIGLWCVENRIGIFGASPELRREWSLRGFERQRTSNTTNSFYYWSTPEGRERRAVLGRPLGAKAQMRLKIGIFNPTKRSEYARLGAKSHKGKIAMHMPGSSTFIRVSRESMSDYTAMGYIVGGTRSKLLGIKRGPNILCNKRVTDGTVIYPSVTQAAMSCGVTPSAIVHRCKSTTTPCIQWSYVTS